MRPCRTICQKIFAIAALGLACGTAAGCHEEGDVRVLSLTFTGNQALADASLRDLMATKSSGRFPWSRKHFFNRDTFTSDLRRIERAYADHGYADARVVDNRLEFNDSRDGIRIAVAIDEGQPTIVERIEVRGFDVLSGRDRGQLDNLPLRAGQPKDRQLVTAARDLAQQLLHNRGYAYATVDIAESPGADPKHVTMTFTATPGPLSYFGPISIAGNKSVGDAVIRRTLTFKPGELYREGEVLRSQRRLQGLPLFQLTNIRAHGDDTVKAERVPVAITVTEAPPQRTTFRIGYGSEEQLRVSTEWSHLNFMGNARTVTAEAKWSRLERGGRVSFGQPAFFWHTALSITTDAWWAHEPAYTSSSAGGRVKITRPFGGADVGPRRVSQSVSLTFVHQYLSYQVVSSVLEGADRSSLIALGLDPDTGAGKGTLGSIQIDFERRATDRPVDPMRGYLATVHVEHATPALRGTFNYDDLQAELRTYRPLSGPFSVAARVRGGTVIAAVPSDVPFSQLYFLGGSTSLRGWGRYQVGPLDSQGQVVGGRTLLLLSTEVRYAINPKMAAVGFMDAGNVWPGHWQARLGDLRYDVGPGVRYQTPIGAFRADLGVQLNPIEGLVVDGKPMTRRWRVSFSIGQAF